MSARDLVVVVVAFALRRVVEIWSPSEVSNVKSCAVLIDILVRLPSPFHHFATHPPSLDEQNQHEKIQTLTMCSESS